MLLKQKQFTNLSLLKHSVQTPARSNNKHKFSSFGIWTSLPCNLIRALIGQWMLPWYYSFADWLICDACGGNGKYF